MDQSPKGSRVRTTLAAAVLGVALAVGGYLVGLDSRPPPAPPLPPEAVPVEPEPAIVPEAALGRSDLIGIAAAAADAFAGGPAPVESRAGRRFSIRIPFGCAGPGDREMATGWSYDEEQQTLRVRVTPVEWGEVEWVTAAIPAEATDAVEGFWLPRPWTRSERCPDRPLAPAAGPSSVGVAQFFGDDSNRASQRRGRPLEVVANVEPEAVPTAGLQLLLEGRIATVPGRRTTALCHSRSASERPTCLVAAEFDRISVVNPATREEIANWRL